MTKNKNYVGKEVVIDAGTKVRTQGIVEKQQMRTVVRVRSQEPTRSGKVRISWKRNGYAASTIIG